MTILLKSPEYDIVSKKKNCRFKERGRERQRQKKKKKKNRKEEEKTKKEKKIENLDFVDFFLRYV